MAVHACLKNESKDDEKCHNPMSWLKLFKVNTRDKLHFSDIHSGMLEPTASKVFEIHFHVSNLSKNYFLFWLSHIVPKIFWIYDLKFLQRQVWANAVDPDQTSGIWSGSTVLAIPSESFGYITLWWTALLNLLIIIAIFGCVWNCFVCFVIPCNPHINL